MGAEGKLRDFLQTIFCPERLLQQEEGSQRESLVKFSAVAQRILSSLRPHPAQGIRYVDILYMVIEINHA